MAQTHAKPKVAYVGCFTTEKRKARGKGIAVFRIDPQSGIWRFVQACDYIHNPHYVALDRSEPGVLFGVRRASREVVSMRLPAIAPGAK